MNKHSYWIVFSAIIAQPENTTAPFVLDWHNAQMSILLHLCQSARTTAVCCRLLCPRVMTERMYTCHRMVVSVSDELLPESPIQTCKCVMQIMMIWKLSNQSYEKKKKKTCQIEFSNKSRGQECGGPNSHSIECIQTKAFQPWWD